MAIKSLLFLIPGLQFMTMAQAVSVVNEPVDRIVYLVNLNQTAYADVEGSPYAEEEFRAMTIEGEERTRFIRVNVVDEIVEVREGGVIKQLRLREGMRMTHGKHPKKELVVETALDDEGTPRVIVVEKVKEMNGHTLYVKKRKRYIPKKQKEAFQKSTVARFIDLPDALYITNFKSGTSELLELPRRKKAFLNFFGSDKKTLDKYMNKEKLDFENRDDLVKILTFVMKNRRS